MNSNDSFNNWSLYYGLSPCLSDQFVTIRREVSYRGIICRALHLDRCIHQTNILTIFILFINRGSSPSIYNLLLGNKRFFRFSFLERDLRLDMNWLLFANNLIVRWLSWMESRVKRWNFKLRIGLKLVWSFVLYWGLILNEKRIILNCSIGLYFSLGLIYEILRIILCQILGILCQILGILCQILGC